MDHGLEEQKRIIADLLKLAGEFQLRVVATNDVPYVTPAIRSRTTRCSASRPAPA